MAMAASRDITLFIEPPSYHFQENRLFDSNSAKFGGDNLLAPYSYLRERFAAYGIPVHTADRLRNRAMGSAINIYVSMGIQDHYATLAQRTDVVLSGYFGMECPIVEPSLYRELRTVQKYCKRIFTWSDSESLERFVGGPLRCQSFRWPQSYDTVHEAIWSRTNRKFLVMINANKLPRLYWQELYTERMRAVEFFSRTGEIDLYGVGWDRPSMRVGKPGVPWTVVRMQEFLVREWQKVRPNPLLTAARKVYRGRAGSKSETLGNYTFALCFENMILKGWMTEKLFDCFFTGTIPIYWGAPDVTDYVPEDCFIDMRQFASYDALRTYLKSLGPQEIATYKEKARDYLASEKYQPFTKEAFAQIFHRIVEEDTGLNLLAHRQSKPPVGSS